MNVEFWIKIWSLAIYRLGYSGSEVGKFLNLKSSGVSIASRRGEKILRDEKINFRILNTTHENLRYNSKVSIREQICAIVLNSFDSGVLSQYNKTNLNTYLN